MKVAQGSSVALSRHLAYCTLGVLSQFLEWQLGRLHMFNY